MKFFAGIIFLFLFVQNFAFCAEFAEYRYSKYLGMQQQLQARRAMAYRNQMRYNQSPTRNIRYPRTSNSYPNIERNTYRPLTRNERYSSTYYQRRYGGM